MHNLIKITGAILLLAFAFAFGQSPQPEATSTPAASARHSEPKFDISNIDTSIDPCTDFYQYACGNWIKNNPIPSDYSDWLSFIEVSEHNLAVLKQILEKASANDPSRSSVTQKIGDYYHSCMDEDAINRKRYSPLAPEFDRIAAIKDKKQLIDVLAHESIIGSSALFSLSSNTDLHNANMEIAYLDQAGLTLPDRDYYLKDDADMAKIRTIYLDHLKKMFAMIGQGPQRASASAQTVMKIETALAKASMDRTLRRDPKNLDHKMTVRELEASAPNLHFKLYFASAGTPSFSELNVASPDFIKGINALVAGVPLAEWKTYLTWQMLNPYAQWLSQDFVEQDFKFQQALSGQQQLPARWKRCVNSTDASLGEALGQPYVDATFGTEGKERALKMVDEIEKALNSDISSLSWMSDASRKQAFLKLAAIRNKIGFPDKWRDYSKLEIVRGDFFTDLERANEFEINRQLQKIGKPVDKSEWGMTPPTVNAYYSPDRNEIVFPAGILQPPFFDRGIDDAVNFGAIGIIIGHELTHGFDDEGRKFDAQGNLRDWWTPQDAQEFEKRASCIADEYGSFTVIDDLKLNGRLTLGENTADSGGAHLAWIALHDLLKENDEDPNKKIDGYTLEQRYFLGFARAWCENITPETLRVDVRTDPHSPGKWRVNGVVQNMPEFQAAFGCKPKQPMVRENACRVW